MSKAILAILGVGAGALALFGFSKSASAAGSPSNAGPGALVPGKRYVAQLQLPAPARSDDNDAEAVLGAAFRELDGFAETDVDATADPRNVIVVGTYTGAPFAPGTNVLAFLEVAPAAPAQSSIVLAPGIRYELEVQTLLPLPSHLLAGLFSKAHLGGVKVESVREAAPAGNIRSFILTVHSTSGEPIKLFNDPSLSTFTRATALGAATPTPVGSPVPPLVVPA